MKRAAPSNDNIRQAAGLKMREVVSLYESGKLREAEEACGALIAQHPQDADLYNLLGAILVSQQAFPAAIPVFRKAITIMPTNISYYTNLASALRQSGRAREAVPVLKKAMQLAPDAPEVYIGLGHTALMLENPEDACSCYQQALALSPQQAPAWAHLASTLLMLGRFKDAFEAFDKAVTFNPRDIRSLYNRSFCALTLGNYEEGFQNYELRWVQEGLPTLPQSLVGVSMWDGTPLEGTLLVLKEQGAGDILQSLRFLREVRKRVTRLVVQVPESLRTLVERMGLADAVIDPKAPLPPFESFAPFMSLPRILGATLKKLADDKKPYLSPDKQRMGKWKLRLEGKGKRVGLVWRGAAGHSNDRNRSLSLRELVPLLGVEGVRFFSLQKERGEEELTQVKEAAPIVALGPDIKDYDDTAAILAQLDLLITADTSVAHLAGALGVPCWVMIPFVPDWRWGVSGNGTPWYPSLRLFRQEKRGDWAGVAENIRQALRLLK
jgi:Flp pilus assembly protein TadD